MGTSAAVKKLRAEYLQAFPRCQYSQAVGRHLDLRPRLGEPLCIEHVFNRHGKYSEHWSNYATVCDTLHRWKHSDSVTARIAILHFKWRLAKRTGDERHWNLDALRLASGFNVPGWIETKLETHPLPDWCWRMGKELVEGH